jgi:Na+-driven multidrug efflux pump
LENIDMHLFGGTAMINIPGALYSAALSLMNFLFLSIVGYYGLLIDTSKVRSFD